MNKGNSEDIGTSPFKVLLQLTDIFEVIFAVLHNFRLNFVVSH